MHAKENSDSAWFFRVMINFGKGYDFTAGKLFFDAVAVWRNRQKCAKSYDK
jgi:hypothetical protein